MKREYVRPMLIGEEFKPDEYCSSCGDSGTVYKFKCNAGSRYTTYNVFLNGEDGLPETSDDVAWSTSSKYDCINDYPFVGFGPCSEEHEQLQIVVLKLDICMHRAPDFLIQDIIQGIESM